MNIAIYSRKSVDTGKGESIKSQINLCKDYFSKSNNDCNFTIFEDEGFTGSNINRPAFQNMMESIKLHHFDIVAVYKIDRIARNIVDFVNIYDELENMGVQLVSVTEGFDPRTAVGKMMMLLLASFAEMERMNIAQRVKDNMRELAKIGRWSGGTAPTGYTTHKVMEMGKKVTYLKLDTDKGKDIRKMFEMYSLGYSTFKISKYFDEKGLYYPPKTIQNILGNPVYLKANKSSIKYMETKGYIVYGEPTGKGFLPYNRRPKKKGKKIVGKDKFVAVSAHEPVVDIDLWIKVQKKVDENATQPHPRVSQFSFLAGLVRCNKCGKKMTVSPGRTRKNGSRVFYFRCYNKDCDAKFLRIDVAESCIIEEIKRYINKDHLVQEITSKNKNMNLEKDIKAIKRKIKENDKAIDNLVDKLAILSNEASKAITRKIEQLTKNNQALKESLLINERSNLVSKMKNDNIDALHSQIVKFVNSEDMDIRKIIVKTIIKTIDWDSDNGTISVELLG
ncbi:recombinase family protein [Clostridiaceae bacterium M8S5]|nr:recombinase family protein [Clostridiaceae bacterium M8S5]